LKNVNLLDWKIEHHHKESSVIRWYHL